jgi:hypothetical protein
VGGLLAAVLAANLAVMVLVGLVLDRAKWLRLRPRRVAFGAGVVVGVANLAVIPVGLLLADRLAPDSSVLGTAIPFAALWGSHVGVLLGARLAARDGVAPRARAMLLLAVATTLATVVLLGAAFFLAFPSFNVALPTSFH